MASARAVELDSPCVEHLDLRTTRRHHAHGVAGGVAFWLVALVFLVALVGPTMPTPLYVIYQAKWGFSATVLTLVFAVYAAGVLTSLLVFGRLSDEIGRTSVLLGALALAVASTLVFLFATGVAMLFAARLLSGFAAGLTQGTAAAALAELEPSQNVHRAALTSAAITSGAVGLGPLLAGILAEYAAWKTHLVFVVYLCLLVAAVAAVLLVPETVADRRPPTLRVQRLAVPEQVRAPFVSAALAGFSVFALTGLFASLVPSFLGRELHQHNHAAIGLVVFAFFGVATAAQLALHRLLSRNAMLLGIGWLLAGLALLMLGLDLRELAVFVAGTLASGIGAGLAIMGALASINRIAPPDHRGEILSAFFVAGYVGLALPAVGVGIASEHVGFFTSTLACSIVVAVLLTAAGAYLSSSNATSSS